jgi:hypothetical protein
MFGNTHRFLPIRNGLAPNTAHIMLHLATAATLFILLARLKQLSPIATDGSSANKKLRIWADNFRFA